MGDGDLSIPYIDSLTVFLIVFNALIFIFQATVLNGGFLPASTELVFEEGLYFTLITYSFFHGDLTHLVANMLSLFIYGLILEKELGKLKLATIYIFGAVGGALLHTSIDPIPLVGASAAIFLLKTVTILLYPTKPIYKYIPSFRRITDRIPLPLVGNFFTVLGLTSLTFALPLIGLGNRESIDFLFLLLKPGESIFNELLTFSQGGAKGVSNLGHLGGMLAGLVMAFIINSQRMIKGLKLTSLFMISLLILNFGSESIGIYALILLPLVMHKVVPKENEVSETD